MLISKLGCMVVGYGMEEAEQDQYEARLKELFDSFDLTATGSLGQEELTDLCHTLQLDEVAPSLMQTLLQNNQTDRVHFEQFKEALIFILSTSFEGHFSNEENYQEPDSSAEVQPKYIKDGKCYGRRSVPEFCESMEEFPEVTVIEARADKIHSDCIGSGDCGELWKNSTFNSEEYEAEGQLKYWNPDDVSTPRSLFTPTQGWIEDKLQTVCEDLGVTRDGSLSRKELVSIWEQLSIHNLDKEMLEDVFLKLDQDGMMSVQEFFYGVFRNGKPPTPSSSTPYRQLKRHLSTQPFDESGRRTTTPSAMTSTIGFRLFSCLDDGNGYASADQILDMWQEEGIENSLETLKTLDFGLDEKINLTELTMALENELLITKNGIHQAALASFKNEIRHSFARVDQVLREKEKLRLDLEKAEKLKSQMASEVDDHHAAIERLNEYNLRKLDQEYRDRIAALKADLTKERDLVLQQANKQQTQLELEIEKVKSEENYTRDRLTLSLKENSRLEKELLETAEKLVENENLVIKLQKNLDKILNEKFGELDPNSAEFLLQEEKFACLRKEYEQQCRELQDRIDELQLELEEYQVPGRNVRPSMKNSLCEELNQMSGGVESDQGLGSEECHPLNMTLEAEMIIEQIKEQNQQNLENVKLELEDKVSSYEKQLEEMKSTHEKEREDMKQMWNKDTVRKEEQISDLKSQVTELQSNLETLKSEQQRTKCLHAEERDFLKRTFQEEKAKLQEQLKKDHKEALQVRVEQAQECFVQEKEKLIQSRVQLEAEMEGKIRELQEKFQQEKYELEQMHEEQMVEVEEKHAAEKENLENMLAGRNSQLLEERCEIDKLLEENASLQLEIVTLKEEGGASSQKLKELNGSQVEMLQKVEVSKKEKLAAYKMVDRLKKQVADLKLRNEKLNSENAELCQKNSKNQADLEDLKQRLAEILRHKEKRDTEKRHQEEWERERARIKEELQNNKDKSSAVVSSLESALSESMLRNHLLEQEKLLLNQELDDVKQQLSCFEALQNKTANVMDRNEKLLKEKSALNDELNLYAEKVAKVSFLESQIANMKEERQFWEQQSQTLKAQLEMSQEKIYGIDEALQSNNLQMARLKSDLRVTQQEKESLKQEVMSLHKQLQNANDKNQVLELAIQSSGFQNQQKKLYWDDLAHLMEQEQQLLRRENDRLQKEVHNTKGELVYSREKIRQLESTVLTLKHQKHQSQSSLVKAAEQEKLTLKRDYEHLQKELSLANQKVSQMNYLEREIETQKIENEALKNKQVKLERQLMEMLQSNSSLTHRQSQHTQELQQLQEQVCHMVPKDQLIQLQQRLLQAERRSQQLQEELENQAPATPMQQESQEQLLKKMEGRMIDVEQKLRTVRLLLQEKVNQLKEQHTKNTKADEVIKDLYVENSQLLKALELTEQRQKTTERKNYLLEEKIANLNKIVRDLTQCSLSGSSSHHLRS
nr:PREDICTED: ninein isoform X3 [Latimeria chalumnae]|eukprot:XP_005996036.1 PREDICTED: ninein isoform X3 [Latimeria chalumnae]